MYCTTIGEKLVRRKRCALCGTQQYQRFLITVNCWLRSVIFSSILSPRTQKDNKDTAYLSHLPRLSFKQETNEEAGVDQTEIRLQGYLGEKGEGILFLTLIKVSRQSEGSEAWFYTSWSFPEKKMFFLLLPPSPRPVFQSGTLFSVTYFAWFQTDGVPVHWVCEKAAIICVTTSTFEKL